MGASKEFPITDHALIHCTCDDPDCPYCAECREQKCFHTQSQKGIRDVSIDEVFTWKEDLIPKAREAFGGLKCDVSPQTYSDLKVRCDKLDRGADPFFEHVRNLVSVNGITIHMVKQGEVPDGVLRGCTCGAQVPKS